MGRVTNRRHLRTYVTGQLSDLQRKTLEPIADAAGQPPRTLQQFLGLLQWDEGAVRDRLNASLARYGHAQASTIAQQLLWDVRRFAGLASQSDDITLVVATIG